YYSEKELEHRLKETQELNEEVKQAASEEGFDSKTRIESRDYRLEHITLKQSFDQLSEKFLDEGYINESNAVQSFLRNEFYNLLIRNRLINYRIVITRALEEYDDVKENDKVIVKTLVVEMHKYYVEDRLEQR